MRVVFWWFRFALLFTGRPFPYAIAGYGLQNEDLIRMPVNLLVVVGL